MKFGYITGDRSPSAQGICCPQGSTPARWYPHLTPCLSFPTRQRCLTPQQPRAELPVRCGQEERVAGKVRVRLPGRLGPILRGCSGQGRSWPCAVEEGLCSHRCAGRHTALGTRPCARSCRAWCARASAAALCVPASVCLCVPVAMHPWGVHPHACLSGYPHAHVSVCPCISASICPCICVSMCPCIHTSLHLYVCASMYPYSPASVCPCVHVSIHLCVCASVCPCINQCIPMSTRLYTCAPG